MSTPDTSVTSGKLLKVSWSAPSSDNNFSVTAYRILIGNNSGAFAEDTNLCDGSDSTTFTNRYCYIDMEVLAASPYSIAFDTLMTFKAQAFNERGWSDESDANTSGTKMQRAPDAVGALSSGSSTNKDQIHIDWDALSSPANGNNAILSYSLEWDSGTAGVTWTSLVGSTSDSTDTEFILSTGVTTGVDYQFRARAKNSFGFGDYSSVVTLKAA